MTITAAAVAAAAIAKVVKANAMPNRVEDDQKRNEVK